MHKHAQILFEHQEMRRDQSGSVIHRTNQQRLSHLETVARHHAPLQQADGRVLKNSLSTV